jgi:hypothetical protein
MTQRVFHPSLDAWQDVPDDDVKDWTDSGWLDSKPEHVDDSAALAPGEGYAAPVVVDISGNAAAYINAPESEPAEAAAPAGNASLAEWQDYARSLGATDDDLADKGRDALRAEYGA